MELWWLRESDAEAAKLTRTLLLDREWGALPLWAVLSHPLQLHAVHREAADLITQLQRKHHPTGTGGKGWRVSQRSKGGFKQDFEKCQTMTLRCFPGIRSSRREVLSLMTFSGLDVKCKSWRERAVGLWQQQVPEDVEKRKVNVNGVLRRTCVVLKGWLITCTAQNELMFHYRRYFKVTEAVLVRGSCFVAIHTIYSDTQDCHCLTTATVEWDWAIFVLFS